MQDHGSDDIERVKRRLAERITLVLKSQGLTQAQIAGLLRIDQPGVSRLARGRVERFSIERLFRFLNDLDRDVEIRVTIKPRNRLRAGTRVR